MQSLIPLAVSHSIVVERNRNCKRSSGQVEGEEQVFIRYGVDDCRPTSCASAAAEARSTSCVQNSNDLARLWRSAASACSAATPIQAVRGDSSFILWRY